ncbi:MAG: MafI family immunity protein [Microcoleus sp.]|uniref:MafI family immunity protein n=1 Tax=Microcoleus sp. TaxID=44472 RepID=UPI003C7303C4
MFSSGLAHNARSRSIPKGDRLMFDYKLVESKLHEVINIVKPQLSQTQIEFIVSDIQVGEWNLALETLCDILIEEEISIDLKGYELLQEVGNILNVERETWEMLKVHVTP